MPGPLALDKRGWVGSVVGRLRPVPRDGLAGLGYDQSISAGYVRVRPGMCLIGYKITKLWMGMAGYFPTFILPVTYFPFFISLLKGEIPSHTPPTLILQGIYPAKRKEIPVHIPGQPRQTFNMVWPCRHPEAGRSDIVCRSRDLNATPL